MDIIGIAGDAMAGKDTFALGLKNYGYKRVACADPIKEIARNYFFSDLADNVAQKTPAQRFLLQHIGTNLGREFWADYISRFPEEIERLKGEGYDDPTDVWMMHFQDAYKDFENNEYLQVSGIAVPDIRTPFEIDFLRSFGDCLIVKIIREDRPRIDERSASHSIENSLTGYKDYDFSIINDGTIEELQKCAYRLVAWKRLGIVRLAPVNYTMKASEMAYNTSVPEFVDA